MGRHRWQPTPQLGEILVKMKLSGANLQRMASVAGVHKDTVARYLRDAMARTDGAPEPVYHGKEATHKRMSIYFDISKQGEALKK